MRSGVTVKNSIADPFYPAFWDRKTIALPPERQLSLDHIDFYDMKNFLIDADVVRM